MALSQLPIQRQVMGVAVHAEPCVTIEELLAFNPHVRPPTVVKWAFVSDVLQ